MTNNTLIIYRSNDPYELPVSIADTLEEASTFIGCSIRTLYNTKHLTGTMKANGYTVELVTFHKDKHRPCNGTL